MNSNGLVWHGNEQISNGMAEWRDAMAKRSDVTKLMAMNGNDNIGMHCKGKVKF